jgi:hypothetical protein
VALNMDYFENSRRAVLSQRAYAIHNPMDWRGYGPNIWGLTASDGPGWFKLDYLGQTRQFYSYAARGIGLYETHDDGTIAPTASIGSLPFAPEVVLPAIHAMHKQYGRHIMASTVSSTLSTRASTTTCLSSTADACAAWAGWTTHTWVSTRGRSSR